MKIRSLLNNTLKLLLKINEERKEISDTSLVRKLLEIYHFYVKEHEKKNQN